MPELPEVQTMVDGLNKTVLNTVILDVWSDSEKNIKKPKNFQDFKKSLVKAKIKKIQRKGKVILFFLSNEKVLIVHPKMSGHFLYGYWEKTEDGWKTEEKALADPMNRFIHFIFFLDNKKMLAFSDLRRFARIEVWDKKDLSKADILNSIGPDALEISFKDFKEIIKTKKKIKQLLMEQKLISGIGNIYSDEILFKAKINPFRTADSLNSKEIKKIYSAMKPILKEAVKLTGSSISDFRKVNGKKGSFQEIAKVYHKEKCVNCGQKIIKKKISGRSANYCGHCQK